MIDTKELRRLAQAATPGPWILLPVGDKSKCFAVADINLLSVLTVVDECGTSFGAVYLDGDAKFIAAANPAAISELLDRIEEAGKFGDGIDWIQRALQAEAKVEEMKRRLPCQDISKWPSPSAQPAPSIPEGWKLVPIEPTPEMIDAAEYVDWGDADVRGSCINAWDRMLAAAPEAKP